MREKQHRRGNYLAFQNLPWAQDVSGSNPDAPTNIFCDLQPSRKKSFPSLWGQIRGTYCTIPNFSSASCIFTARYFSSFTTASTLQCSAIFTYRIAMPISECPRIFCKIVTSVPDNMDRVANV